MALCRRLKAGAPDLWSRFVQFSQKSVAASFVSDEDAFLLFQGFGDQCRVRVVTRIGEHADQPNRQYCLDLTVDLAQLEALDDDALTAWFQDRDGPLVLVRTNTAPLLCPLYDTPDDAAPALSMDVAQTRVEALRDRPGLISRLAAAARRAERDYPPSPHVEDQLYGYPFPNPGDKALMQAFHIADWPERAVIADRFEDGRYRQLARRLVFFERPDVLQPKLRDRLAAGIEARLALTAPDARWLTRLGARQEIERLSLTTLDASGLERLAAYRGHLDRSAGA